MHNIDPETEAAKWNSAIINYIIYTCAFLTVTVKKSLVKKPYLYMEFGYFPE